MRWPTVPSALHATALYVVAATSAVVAAPIVLAGDSLTPETWSRVESGTWLVEHYSPYCSHCKQFAPKWKELVNTYEDAAAAHNFYFAQVDCASNGDLCHEHNVKYYPSIFLYRDGAFAEEFEDRRTLEALGNYVEAHYPVGAEKLAAKKEATEQEDREASEEGAWDRREQEVDEMGPLDVVKLKKDAARVVPRPDQGDREKAPLVRDDDDDEEEPSPNIAGHAVLHVADEDADNSGSRETDTTSNPKAEVRVEPEDDDEMPLAPLLADAKKKLDPLYLAPLSTASETPTAGKEGATASTQTPPGAASTASEFVPPAFVAQQPAVDKKRSGHEWPAVDGTVQLLTPGDIAVLTDEETPASFVKYYAPWCSHCKALAPKWKDLAQALAPVGVHVYEVNCDAAENKKACRAQGVQAYPTLKFYNKGASAEYLGKRDVKALETFALKALSATTVKTLSGKYELQRAVKEDEVVVLFLHSLDSKQEDVDAGHAAAKSLMGSSPVYTSSSPELLSLFSVPDDQPTFVTLKDHSLSPSASFALPLASTSGLSTTKRIALIRDWLRSAKLPTVTELTSASFPDLMPTTGSPPLVGLAVLSRKGLGDDGMDKAHDAVRELALGWAQRRRTAPQGQRGQRDVLWAWVDGDTWAGWLRTMYDVKMGGLHGPALVIVDPKALHYWPASLSGTTLNLDDPTQAYALIEDGIYTSQVKPHSSRQFLDRFANSIVDCFLGIYEWCWSHPLLALLAVVGSWITLWRALKRAFAPVGYTSIPNGALGSRGGAGPKRE